MRNPPLSFVPFACSLLIGLGFLPTNGAEVRTFILRSGPSFSGEIAGVNGETVVFKVGRKTLNVAFQELSEADQLHVRAEERKMKPANLEVELKEEVISKQLMGGDRHDIIKDTLNVITLRNRSGRAMVNLKIDVLSELLTKQRSVFGSFPQTFEVARLEAGATHVLKTRALLLQDHTYTTKLKNGGLQSGRREDKLRCSVTVYEDGESVWPKKKR